MEWRKEWGVDTVLEWEVPEVLSKYYPVGMAGHDKMGCPGMHYLNFLMMVVVVVMVLIPRSVGSRGGSSYITSEPGIFYCSCYYYNYNLSW